MKCIVNLSGKLDEKLNLDIDHMELYDQGVEELYNLILNHFPENDWEDLCCNSIEYYEDYIECYLTVI